MKKKILAIVLAVVMAVSVVPFFALADDDTTAASAADRAAAWNENLAPVIEELTDNEESAHWKYVAENNEELSNTMLTYTVFALYDDAWKNGFDQSVSIDRAEEILCSIIEKVDANVGESKFSEILAVLQTASDFNDLLQKVNSYVEISDTLTSDEWTKAFKLIKTAVKLGDLYEDARDEVIEAYARILSVQAANEYYKDMLLYLYMNSEYDVVRTAAGNLYNDIDASVDEIISEEVENQIAFKSSEVLEIAARMAMETNSYTAVALKVYDTGTSVADKLWNTSDQYELMDELYTTFFFETGANEWLAKQKASGDVEAYVFGVDALLNIRRVGATALYNLKVAQNDGIVGKVKNQINCNVGYLDAAELSFLDAAEDVLFTDDLDSIKPVKAIATAATNAVAGFGTTRLYNSADSFSNANGYFTISYCDATGNYMKTAILMEDVDIVLTAASDNLATLMVKYLGADGICSYSFTDLTIGDGKTATVDTALTNGAVYTYTCDGETYTNALDSEFVYPAYNAVTAKSVANAVVTVAQNEVKETVSGTVVTIDQLIDSIFEAIKNAVKAIFSFSFTSFSFTK